MNIRILSIAAALATMSFSNLALAVNCSYYDSQYGLEPPDCQSYYGSTPSSVSQTRIVTPANCGATGPLGSFDLELVYPEPADLAAGEKLAPVVLTHGGGVDPSYWGNNHITASRPLNPYQDLAYNLALGAGMVVVQPVIPDLAGKTPQDSGKIITLALACIGAMTTTGQCGGAGQPMCFNDLLDHVSWGATIREHVILMGHSAGGAASLNAVAELAGSVRALIMLDPAKLMATATLTTDALGSVPVVDLYPDWYGPARYSNNTSLMTIGSSGWHSGPWLPMGMRDYPTCNPNTGCHDSFHTSMMSNAPSYYSAWPDEWENAWCAPGATCGDSSRVVSQCPSPRHPGGQYCGPMEYHSEKVRQDWGISDQWMSYNYQNIGASFKRYAAAFASCFGGKNGRNSQSWVNGYNRYYDDSNASGGTCVNRLGSTSSACMFYSISTCNAAGCMWAANMDGGKLIRINNGQTNINEYYHHANREFSKGSTYQGYNKICVGGTHNGQTCSSQADCSGGYCAGRFNEFSEVWGGTINCQSGPE